MNVVNVHVLLKVENSIVTTSIIKLSESELQMYQDEFRLFILYLEK